MSGCLSELVRFQAEQNPDAIAILAPGRKPLSYGRLNHHVAEVVEALNALGNRAKRPCRDGAAGGAGNGSGIHRHCVRRNVRAPQSLLSPKRVRFSPCRFELQGSVGAQRRGSAAVGAASPRHSAHRAGPDAMLKPACSLCMVRTSQRRISRVRFRSAGGYRARRCTRPARRHGRNLCRSHSEHLRLGEQYSQGSGVNRPEIAA